VSKKWGRVNFPISLMKSWVDNPIFCGNITLICLISFNSYFVELKDSGGTKIDLEKDLGANI